METTTMTFFEMCLTAVSLGIGWMIIMWLDKNVFNKGRYPRKKDKK